MSLDSSFHDDIELLKISIPKLYCMHKTLNESLLDCKYKLVHSLSININDNNDNDTDINISNTNNTKSTSLQLFTKTIEEIKEQKIVLLSEYFKNKNKRQKKAKPKKESIKNVVNSKGHEENDSGGDSDNDDNEDDSGDSDNDEYADGSDNDNDSDDNDNDDDDKELKEEKKNNGKNDQKQKLKKINFSHFTDSKKFITQLTKINQSLPLFHNILSQYFEMSQTFVAAQHLGKTVIVFWSMSYQMGKPALDAVIDFLSTYEVHLTDIIFISKHGITPPAKKWSLSKLLNDYNVRIFEHAQLEKNIMHHDFFTKNKHHRKIVNQELINFLTKYKFLDEDWNSVSLPLEQKKIKAHKMQERLENQMPRIKKSDIVCMYHDFQIGDIICIETKGQANNYRIVVPSDDKKKK
jgi:hypothetical protein